MELDLRKLLKLIALLVMASYLAFAYAADEAEEPAKGDEKETVTEENSPIMLREQGDVEGYVSLTVSEQPIDATYMPESLGKAAGKVLILPGRGQDIDSDGVIHTLRIGLTKAGWSTMTVAMHYELTPNIYLAPSDADKKPETDSSETTPEQTANDTAQQQPPEETAAAPSDTETPAAEGDDKKTEAEQAPYVITNEARIAAAISYLAEKQQAGPTILIGFGEAAALVNDSFSMANGEVGIIWINANMKQVEPQKVKAVLDLISDFPSRQNTNAIQRRADMIKANAMNYEQRRIVTTSPNFYGVETNVLGIVRGWLHKHFIAKDDA